MSAYKAAFQDSKFMPTEALAFHKPDVFLSTFFSIVILLDKKLGLWISYKKWVTAARKNIEYKY